LLNDNGLDFTYREYTKEPLSADELRAVFAKLGMGPGDVLRARDAKKAGLSGTESDAELIELMVGNPRLLQRPIGVLGDRAELGRPPEKLLRLKG